MIDLKILIKNGVQFGHQAWRWCPKMARFIWGKKNGVHLIDVSKTAVELERAAKFLEGVAAEGKQILWVGTKPAAQNIIQACAEKLNAPYVRNRWIGGTLTNFSQVKKSVTKLLHYEDILSKTEKYSYNKKEFGVFQKLVDRLNANVGGIRDLAWPIGAIIIIDARKEAVTIKEAISAGIPVVALVDTNADPTGIDFVIPGNDDVARSISVIAEVLASAVERGQQNIEKNKKEREAKAALDKELAAKDKVVDKKEAAPKKPAVQVVPQKAVKQEVATQKIAEKKEAEAPVKKATAKKTDKAK
jgi:small subunit ribosomal protein S2